MRALRVVIMGRPNVGKSTLFNRLTGRRRALVHDRPGVTRDRIIEEVTWILGGKKLRLELIDTGGVGAGTFAEEIEHQVKVALTGADLALLVVDAQCGVMAEDLDLMRRFQEEGVFDEAELAIVVNKVDADQHESLGNDFYSLGVESVLTVSAEHGRGISDIEDLCMKVAGEKDLLEDHDFGEDDSQEDNEDSTEDLDETEEDLEEEDAPREQKSELTRIAIVGRPNVGKSTLVNALMGEKRMITSPVAGTTTDAVDVEVELDGHRYLLVDTAGVRRKGKTEQGIEVLSVVQTKKALEQADVVILVLDGETGISDQDEKIGGMIEEAGRSVILAMNKWDTQKANPKFTKDLAADRIRSQMAFLSFAPIMFMSAKDGTGLRDLPELIEEIIHQRDQKLPTHEFTEWLRKESEIHNPQNAKFFMCHQSGRNPPTFVIHVNDPEKVHFSLRRHFVNAMRERWGFMGTPIRLMFIEGKNRRSLPKKRHDKKAPAKGKAAKATQSTK